MMAPASVAPPQISTSTSPPPHSPTSTSPTSTRSRIRAFNYLRGHHHSTPPAAAPAPAPAPVLVENLTTMTTATVQPASGTADEPQAHSTTSWLPTVGGISGLTRTPSGPSADAVATTEVFSNNSAHTNGGAGSQILGLDGAADPGTGTHGNTSGGPEASSSIGPNGLAVGKIPTIRFVPHVDPRSTRRPHTFTPMERAVKQATDLVKVGRFSDRDNGNPVGFKSKVVSRRHCEFWWNDGAWYMKDVGSSSGTFLNHVRLSHPNTESKPFMVHDGDIVQLGIDFKGGEELIFRCVKMKLELNRDAKSINQFNVAAHRRIQNLGRPSVNKAGGSDAHAGECAICLLNIAPCQSLFVAPCSHVWHFKCIKPIIDASYPILPCPNCREIADLEAEIEELVDDQWEDIDKAKDDSVGETEGNGHNLDATVEPRAKTPPVAIETESSAPVVGTPPMHIPLANLSLNSPHAHLLNGEGITDPANQTPRNNAGPFILNGTTGRM